MNIKVIRAAILLFLPIVEIGWAAQVLPDGNQERYLSRTISKEQLIPVSRINLSSVNQKEIVQDLKPYSQFELKSLPSSYLLLSSSLFQREWNDLSGELKSSKLELETKAIPLHYANVKEVADVLQKKDFNFLSEKGTVNADDSGNILWVHDYKKRIDNVDNVINQLDQPILQVYIKAKIINIDTEYLRSLGVAFNSSNQSSNLQQGGIENLTIPIAQLGRNVLLEATLDALEKEGHAQLISNPQLITLDRKSATIEAGEEVPYQQTAYNGGTSVAFKKAVLSLQVTPEILPKQRILLYLKINQDQVGSLTLNGVPAINTQQITTQVYVENKSTVVLGGIFEQTDSLQHGRVPGLSKVPLLRGIFSHQNQLNNRSQLLIFVTPIIVRI